MPEELTSIRKISLPPFDEKDLSIVFPEDSGFNLSLGALPDRDLEYDFIFDKQSEVSEVLINPSGGWLVVGQFPK